MAALGLLALFAGVVAAGAGVFGWEFLLSDGRYDYGWVSSLGRSGARSLMGVVGVGLIVFGFVARVVGVAELPLPPEVPGEATQLAESPQSVGASTPRADRRPSPDSDNAGAGAATNRPTTKGDAVSNLATTGTTAASGIASGPPPEQLVTLWNPLTELEGEAGTFVSVQYRFEHGTRPQPAETYVWAIELPGGTKELEYEGNSLREEGELRRLVEVNLVDVPIEWRTWLTREKPQPARRVSNRLTIVPRRPVRSEPAEEL